MHNTLEVRIIEAVQKSPHNISAALEPIADDLNTTVGALRCKYDKIRKLVEFFHLKNGKTNEKNRVGSRKKWTQEEDEYLAYCVNEFGTKRGYRIFRSRYPRTGIAVQNRFNYLKNASDLVTIS